MTRKHPTSAEREIQMTEPNFIPYTDYRLYPVAEMQQRAASFAADLQRRRSIRHFSDRPVPRIVIENCLKAAASAPSGANMQPWHFTAISNPAVKSEIRRLAEAEEQAFYRERASQEWLDDLAPLGTDANKPFLETAPYLIAIFAERYGLQADGSQRKHYYVQESVGIAAGLLIAAVHHAGLVSLTHTPSPMDFLNRILARPKNERPFLLLVVGYPAVDAVVPDIHRKPLDQVTTFVE
jgi:iodotyrosine deiodinase